MRAPEILSHRVENRDVGRAAERVRSIETASSRGVGLQERRRARRVGLDAGVGARRDVARRARPRSTHPRDRESVARASCASTRVIPRTNPDVSGHEVERCSRRARAAARRRRRRRVRRFRKPSSTNARSIDARRAFDRHLYHRVRLRRDRDRERFVEVSVASFGPRARARRARPRVCVLTDRGRSAWVRICLWASSLTGAPTRSSDPSQPRPRACCSSARSSRAPSTYASIEHTLADSLARARQRTPADVSDERTSHGH